MEYSEKLVEALGRPGPVVKVGDVSVECKPVPDGPVGALDPRVLKQVLAREAEAPDRKLSLEEERDRMGGFNYNLNRREIWTKHLLVPASCGSVPVWCHYPRRMGKDRPALVYAHGGGFIGGSTYAVENQCRLIAERADCMVWNVDYSLAPEHPYPIPCTQIYEVTRYLRDHAEEYGVDPGRITVAGDSAGGSLAAVAAQMDRDKGTRCITGQILIYPTLTFSCDGLPGYVRDLSAFEIADEQRQLLPGLVFLGSDEANRRGAENYVQGRCDIKTPYVSPAFGTAEGLPPALFLLAEYDGLRLEGEFYARKLLAAGVSVRVLRYCGMAHAFYDQLGILPQAEAAVNEISAFLLR